MGSVVRGNKQNDFFKVIFLKVHNGTEIAAFPPVNNQSAPFSMAPEWRAETGLIIRPVIVLNLTSIVLLSER